MNERDIIFSGERQGPLQKTSVIFSRTVRRWCRELTGKVEIDESSLRQLYRSGTSVGANIREAQFGESRRVFLHKLKIAEKELGEFFFWFGLLHSDPSITASQTTQELENTALEVRRMLRAAIKTTKENLRNPAPQ
ncbi:MAG: four helix bundle protein [Candidatus Kapabacteria bacterium]|nr:four helix bundle protein [Candidatus Kapabacteria bacterium]